MQAFFRAAAARPRSAWSPEECAVYDARREFELLKLLATDKEAFATARRLGFLVSHVGVAPTSKRAAVVHAAGAASASQQTPAAAAGGNAQQRRSARRSALRHARRRQRLCRCCMMCLLFVLRLRRAADLRRVRGGLGSDCRALHKRSASRPASRASSDGGLSTSSDPPLCSGLVAAPGVAWGSQPVRRRRDGMAAGFLLR